MISSIGVRAPLDLAGEEGGGGGAVTLLPEKITQCPKACDVQTRSNRIKNKNVHNSYVNARIIISKLQLNPDFSNYQGKRQLFRKIGYFEKSGETTISFPRRGKRLLFRVIGRFEKLGFEIGIQL